MNCIAFRRALSQSPASWDEELRAHGRECPGCEAFAQRLVEFESTLVEAVRIDVPEGLASRVLLAHGLRLEGGRRVRRRRLLLAFAAIAALGLAGSWLALAPSRLDSDVLAHIEAEPSHLHALGELSRAEVNQRLAPLGVGVEGELLTISYAGTCWIRGSLGAHLVLQGEKGPVTVLFLPDEPLDNRFPIRDERLQGIIVPAGRGSLAIVGKPGEAVEIIERRLKRALEVASRDGPEIALVRRPGGRYA